MDCLDEETLLAFLAGRLDGPGTSRARDHVAACATCNAIATDLIADVAIAVRATPRRVRAYELVAGAIVGDRYRLVRPLGEGGMGVVWEGLSLEDGARVALKLLKGFDPAAKKRFLREISVTSLLKDPGLVTVVDVLDDVEAGTPALVVELLEGEPLAARLARQGALAAFEAILVARSLARALVTVHGAGLVHRDIKPANVWLTPWTARPVVLLDLGLAKAFEGDVHGTRITRTGHAVGTPAYMAPEQLAGDPGVDGRADLWAVGVVLHECLTGARPYAGTALGQLLQAIHRGPEPTLAGVPPDVAPLLRRLLAPDPRGRPATAADLAAALAGM